MGDEIRITVIATGFDSAESAAKTNVTSFGDFRRGGNINVPTFIRNEKIADPPGGVKIHTLEEEENPDLEIPTFLRRQAD